MMGTYVTAQTSSPPCPHAEGIGAPVCWDCAEGGHIRSPVEGEGVSPSWHRFKKFRRSLGIRDAGYSRSIISSPTGSQVSPEEGLEVGTPLSRRSQPGLILVTGPRVVSPDDKFLKPQLKSWDSESTHVPTHKDEILSVSHSIAVPESTPVLGLTGEKKRWGMQRRTFQIFIMVAIVALVGVIIGIAVAVTQQNRNHSTSLSTSGSGQVSSSSSSSPMPPITATETMSYYVAGASSIPSETDIPSSSSRHMGSAMTSTKTTTTATGKGGTSRPHATSTTSSVAKHSPHTNPIPVQSMTTVAGAPPPTKTSPSNSSRICIGNDGSTYTDPGTGDKFRVECAVAHQGQDIENLEAETMQECISLCAKNKFCKGAIWFNVGPQGTDLNYCWLKSAMDGDVQDTPDAQSVVLL